MNNGIYLNTNEMTSTYYVGGFSVATLNHNSDEFEVLEEMTEEDKDFYYSEMRKDFEMTDLTFKNEEQYV